MTTGEKIKKARLAAGMSQADLGELLGVPHQSIGKYEKGIRNPKKSTIEKLANALGVAPVELYDDAMLKMLSGVETMTQKNKWSTYTPEDGYIGIVNDDISEYQIEIDEDTKALIEIALSLDDESRAVLLDMARNIKKLLDK